MKKHDADYLYEVWRRGGDPDNVDLDQIPDNFDWVFDYSATETHPQKKPRRYSPSPFAGYGYGRKR